MLNSKKTFFLLCLLAACSSETNHSNTLNQLIDPKNLLGSKQVDFSNIGDTKWTQVCFFTPYTVTGISSRALGFDWEVTEKTDIGIDDGVIAVVFATNTEVTEYLTVPRNKINSFQNIPTQCVPRNNAIFTFEDTSYIYRTK